MTRGFIVRGHRRGRHAAHRLRHLRQAQRLPRHAAAAHSSESASRAISDMTAPPEPPIRLTACSPDTDVAVLWHIAYHVPELRKWLVANPKADAPLLELVSQRGGPGVRQALEILFESMEA